MNYILQSGKDSSNMLQQHRLHTTKDKNEVPFSNMCIQHSGVTAQTLLKSVFVDTEMDDVDCMQLDGMRQKLMEEIKWNA